MKAANELNKQAILEATDSQARLIDKLDKFGWPHHLSIWKRCAVFFEK
jgi:hypothetical protein